MKKSAWIVAGSVAVGTLVVAIVAGALAGASTEAIAAPGESTGVSVEVSPTPTLTDEAAETPEPTPSADAPETSTSDRVTASALLATLAIKGRAPKTGYDRGAMFGTPWLDVDRNGCDTRNDVLARDLVDLDHPLRCKVLGGVLHDPYTGRTIDFVRGNTTSTLVQIDHVVALMDSWQKGAQQLTQEQRVAFANDPLNLLAVDGAANAQKGASDAASWLPPQKSFRCEYVARQVSVKAAYDLWVTQAEHDAIARVLASCPDQVAYAPGDALPAPGAASPITKPTPGAPTTPAKPAPVAPAPDVVYANCTAVRAAGAAPIRIGDPGYSRKLDGDGDGIACE